MYCSQCGKKVTDAMLFCPFCGSPIVIPEQEETLPQVKPFVPPRFVQEETAEDAAAEGVQFVPLDIDRMMRELERDRDESVQQEDREETTESQERAQPVQLQGHSRDLDAARALAAAVFSSKGHADSFAPPRRFNPNDIFLDDEDDEEEEYEADEDYVFEEPENSSFFLRHIRGCVSLMLFAIVTVIVLGWLLSGSGQQALARAGLAWRPGVYAQLAYEAYQGGNYASAGSYYESALARDARNYDYANSSGVSYYMSGNTAMAESMARKAIAIDPSRSEAYELMLRLYPDAAQWSQEILELMQTGYLLTGNESFHSNVQ